MLLSPEIERAAWEDALECARRTRRYKFGRLSTLRIVRLLRGAAADAGQPIEASDDELVAYWFAEYDKALSETSLSQNAP